MADLGFAGVLRDASFKNMGPDGVDFLDYRYIVNPSIIDR
jgi:hypothetical protein